MNLGLAGSVAVDSRSHFIWYRGTDSKLYVTWWTGSTWENRDVPGASVAGYHFLSPDGAPESRVITLESGNDEVRTRLDAALRVLLQGREQGTFLPRFEADIRKVLEDKSIDILSIATPNHWHALAAIWAMQAGKDVYVEKPVSHNVSEGRRIVENQSPVVPEPSPMKRGLKDR